MYFTHHISRVLSLNELLFGNWKFKLHLWVGTQFEKCLTPSPVCFNGTALMDRHMELHEGLPYGEGRLRGGSFTVPAAIPIFLLSSASTFLVHRFSSLFRLCLSQQRRFISSKIYNNMKMNTRRKWFSWVGSSLKIKTPRKVKLQMQVVSKRPTHKIMNPWMYPL